MRALAIEHGPRMIIVREIRPRSLEPDADLANFTTVLDYDRADN